MNAPLTTADLRGPVSSPRRLRLLNNPVLLERGLGVILWAGLVAVLVV